MQKHGNSKDVPEGLAIPDIPQHAASAAAAYLCSLPLLQLLQLLQLVLQLLQLLLHCVRAANVEPTNNVAPNVVL